jgi:putative heme-binding domain-containing protein
MPTRNPIIIALISLLAILTFGESAFSESPARIPWTTSQVNGSPEPPLPYQLERIYPKLTFMHPLDMGFAPGSNRRFVAEQSPRIYSFPDDPACAKADIFFDATQVRGLDKIPNCVGIDTVFGFTFHPKFAENHYAYVCYMLRLKDKADRHKGLRVSRFTVNVGANDNDPPHCDMATEVLLLEYWGAGHCGGCLKFGPDGMLYISTGDGGDPTPPDPFNTGQDITDLLSSILRIDVDNAENGKPYAIPKDNPFVNTPNARPEIWAYGLRNPWRFSFDRATGELWVGDVGWETWEMVDRIERGGNYGWSITEGPGPVHPDAKRGPTPIIPPTLYLSHAESCSVTGGFVYHGKKLPGLIGQYVFGDWETRRLFAAPLVEKGLGKHRTIGETDQRIVAFGEDHDGELYVVDYEGGGIYQIIPQPAEATTAAFPRTLSGSGLFASITKNEPAPGVTPFTIHAEQWVDGATSERWIAIPGQETIKQDKDGKKIYPKNSVLTRTFSLETEPGNPASRRRIETQMLHFDGRRWNGYSYRWNDQQTDATLVDAAGDEMPLTIRDPAVPKGLREQSWRFTSRAQCATCHNSWAGFTLAFNPQQLKDGSYESLFDSKVKPIVPPTLVDPHDEFADLNLRARSYLQTNCAHCHRMGGGGSANIDLNYAFDNAKTKTIDIAPTQGTFGIADARIIAPGDPSRSLLFYRMAKLGSGHMPHTGSVEIDAKGLELIAKWIAQMPPAGQPASADAAALEQLQHAKPGSDAVIAAANELLHSTSGAVKLMRAIDTNLFPSDMRQKVVTLAYANDRDEVRGLFGRFIPADQRIKTLGASFKSADVLVLEGDANRGRKVFAEVGGGLCLRCHRTTDQGESFGPDLTHIAAKYGRTQLLDNIVEPSKTIADGFTAYRVKTKKGDVQLGLITSRSEKEIVLKTGPGVEVRIPAAEVESIKPETASLMPEGLLGGLTAQQAADLLEYLQSLK